ncbi:unnamed protein product [Bursaphelenchus xylophilus]|uniref:(pine wood nematode) hypothetical protein n=1 Tax=Bursaphelenchus xylophilus TaxID=6326 RepID=A0A1I7RV56_BURXY|nr:unnamed protein product [Bursaphelenchus xylophilus]CAG9105081.1 unnamed protein product [Bursaphelenchus xylophilus]
MMTNVEVPVEVLKDQKHEKLFDKVFCIPEIATAPELALGSGSEPEARAGAGNFGCGSGSRAQSRSQAPQRPEK